MSVLEGKNTAVTLAKSELRKIDLNDRLQMHGFSPFINGIASVRLFGEDLVFLESKLELKNTDRNDVKINRQILFLHYLLCDHPITSENELITFRQLPGGRFYWEPFLAKTINPLMGVIGSNLEKLKKGLSVFDFTEEKYGDFSAKIHIVGEVYIILIYNSGDKEFPARIDLLFDSSISKICKTEDVSVMCSEVCFSIINNSYLQG